MINRLLLAFIVLLAGATLGLGLGLYIGWQAWPVTYLDTDLASLRQDYQDDYVVMVATAYSWDGDLARARARLERLSPAPLELVEQTAARLEKASAAGADQQRLSRLALDLRATQPNPAAGSGQRAAEAGSGEPGQSRILMCSLRGASGFPAARCPLPAAQP